MEIAVLVFDNITALDAVGPLEVVARLPGAEVRIVGKEKGPVRAGKDSGGLALTADYGLGEVVRPDIVIVPGGMGTRTLVHDTAITDWIERVDETSTWTTSVCTGALLLGAAGLLKGRKATTHWRAMDLLAGYGAIPTSERVVVDGKLITAAGVSAGIDMALYLASRIAGPEVAQSVQLQIEYDPHPPFDSGSLAKATPRIRQLAGGE